MRFILRQTIVSLGLIIVGLLIYFMLSYLTELPGKETIEQKFMDDKKKKKRVNKTIGKIYTVILLIIVAVFNIITYIITKG